MDTKKHSWHGPKQIWIMIYTAILFLIGTSIIGGNNNTVFPMFSEIRGFDINIINIVFIVLLWMYKNRTPSYATYNTTATYNDPNQNGPMGGQF